MGEVIVLSVGEDCRVAGLLQGSITYAGMPHEGAYSMVHKKEIGGQYAYNLFYPRYVRNLDIGGISFLIDDVTPEQIVFRMEQSTLNGTKRSAHRSGSCVAFPLHLPQSPIIWLRICSPPGRTGTAARHRVPQAGRLPPAATLPDQASALRTAFIFHAARVGDAAALEAVAAASGVGAPDDFGRTPLHAAAESGAQASVDWLLAHAAPTDTADPTGVTPLMLAAASPAAGVTRALLAAGAQVYPRDRAGRTALMYAAWADRAEQIRLLTGAGTDGGLTDERGFTALDIALLRERTGATAALRAAGVPARFATSPDVQSGHGFDPARLGEQQKGWSPLVVAASRDDEAAFRRLLATGATLVGDYRGITVTGLVEALRVLPSLANDDTTSDHDPSAHPDVVDSLPGFTGSSGGWVQEPFDLSAYEGESALVRFLYVTDWATELTGFFVYEIAITETGGTVFDDGLESGDGNWDLEGWQRTTGLVTNDWQLTFVNPHYDLGKFSGYEIQDDSILVYGNYQYDLTQLDTSALGSDAVTIVVSNHQPEDQSFAAMYRLLVSKRTAKK